MKQTFIKQFIAASALVLLAAGAMAQTNYDFANTGSDGTVLYYKVTGAQSVTVYGHRIDTSDATTVYVGTLVIPDTVVHDGISYAVTAVGDSAFFRQTEISSLTLPPTLRTIGTASFFYCRSLAAIDVPEGVTEIGVMSFGSCRHAARVDIPSSVTSIGTFAFYALGRDTTCAAVVFHDAPCAIANYAFNIAKAQVDLGDSVVSIGTDAFNGCDMTSVAVPPSVRHLGDGAFSECMYLLTATLPGTLDTIPARMFNGCLSLEEFNIPDSVKYIGENAFLECLHFNGDLVLPERLDYIGASAFAYTHCTGIVSKAVVPPTAFSSTFDGISTAIYVQVP